MTAEEIVMKDWKKGVLDAIAEACLKGGALRDPELIGFLIKNNEAMLSWPCRNKEGLFVALLSTELHKGEAIDSAVASCVEAAQLNYPRKGWTDGSPSKKGNELGGEVKPEWIYPTPDQKIAEEIRERLKKEPEPKEFLTFDEVKSIALAYFKKQRLDEGESEESAEELALAKLRYYHQSFKMKHDLRDQNFRTENDLKNFLLIAC